MANVQFIRPELGALLPQYNLIRDAIAGETVIKRQGTTYLPIPNERGNEDPREQRTRYNSYLKRAVYYNLARRTLYGLVGQVFAKDPLIETPPQLDPLISNATGAGISLIQLAKQAVNFSLAYARGGIMVDYPTTDDTGGATIADLEAGRIRPTLYVYSPFDIVNWRTIDRGAEEILSLVVIHENYPMFDDGFEISESSQFRVLRLDESGEYVHEVWREEEPTKATQGKPPANKKFMPAFIFRPKDASGNALREIPFMFMGAENNDVNPDNPSFYDLASLNLAHYRNSADYEESCFVCGQPTPVATGLTEEWVKNVLNGRLDFGSRGGIPLPAGANATLIQASPNTMIKEAMDAKERQMVALGAKIVEQKTIQRTATEVALEAGMENSTLSSVAKNVSTAFEWALKWAARWIGQADDGVRFELNTDFAVNRMTSEQRRQLVEEWQKGAITFNEMRASLRIAGIATVSDEEARTQIAQDNIEMIGLPVPVNAPE